MVALGAAAAMCGLLAAATGAAAGLHASEQRESVLPMLTRSGHGAVAAEASMLWPGSRRTLDRSILQAEAAGSYGGPDGFQGFNFGAGRLQVPLPLPDTLERTPIDPAKGYAIIELEPGVHFVTEGIYNILVIEAEGGVIVIDAPPTMAAVIMPAVREITDAPVTHFVYSHFHVDHAAAAGPLFGGSGVTIVGGTALSEALAELGDPTRPVPTLVVASGDTVALGGVDIKFTELPYSHDRTTTLLELPASSTIMLVDIIFPDWVPFRSFAVTADMRAYIDAHATLLALEWKHFAAGHLSRPATREDVRVATEYLDDAERIVREGLASADNAAVIAGIPAQYLANPWVVVSQIQGALIDYCYERLVPAWAQRLAGVDVFGYSHCTKMVEFVLVDEGF